MKAYLLVYVCYLQFVALGSLLQKSSLTATQAECYGRHSALTQCSSSPVGVACPLPVHSTGETENCVSFTISNTVNPSFIFHSGALAYLPNSVIAVA